MSDKRITAYYVTDLHARIAQGETPIKLNELSRKEFILQMLPHVKSFLTRGYTHKEIAEFIGHVSSGDLKKALAKETPSPAVKKTPKAEGTKKTLIGQTPGKKGKGGSPQPISASP